MWNSVWHWTLGSNEGRQLVVGCIVFDPTRVNVVDPLDGILQLDPVVIVRYDVIISEQRESATQNNIPFYLF
jgi:hypothetical protein